MDGARPTGAHAPPQVLTKEHAGSQRALPPANLHIGSNHNEAAQLGRVLDGERQSPRQLGTAKGRKEVFIRDFSAITKCGKVISRAH